MKKIRIGIREAQGQWLAKVSNLPDIHWDIQEHGDTKKRALSLAKSKALRELVHLIENHELEFKGVVFKVADLTVSDNSFKKLEKGLFSWWKKTLNWMIEKPYLELFSIFSLEISVVCIIILVIFITVLVVWLIYLIIQNQQVFATIIVSLIALSGVLLTATIQTWLAIYKIRIDKQNESLKKITACYEEIIKLLRKPREFSSEEALAIINEFSDKVEIYGSSNDLYQWKPLKKKIILVQSNPSETELIDLHDFRNFVWAIRKEMGHSNNSPMNRYYILKELKNNYEEEEKRKTA